MRFIDLNTQVNFNEDGKASLSNGVAIPDDNYLGLDWKEEDQIDRFVTQLKQQCSIDDPVIVTGFDGSDAIWLIAMDQDTYENLDP